MMLLYLSIENLLIYSEFFELVHQEPIDYNTSRRTSSNIPNQNKIIA